VLEQVMNDTILSPFWYRMADLKPKLRQHVRIVRNETRGDIWYTIQDSSSGRYHRFAESTYQIIGRMNGERTLNSIWDSLNKRLDDEAPGQEEIIKLLGKLHSADLLLCDVSSDAEEVLQRDNEYKRSKLKSRLINPTAQRVPLWDPDQFLEKIVPWVGWLFHRYVGLACLALIFIAGLQAGANWNELSHDLITRSLQPYNLLALCLIYPFIKILHELGHAVAAKLGGGEVHEMGIMFLVFLPVPYVDVSCSTIFQSKYQRMTVSAAGIMVELALASVALIVWTQLQPGFIRDVAFNIALIGSLSSLLFNGNPLLRYDAYYVLADAVAIPNLYQRSSQYIYYLCQRYLFGAKESVSPAVAQGESIWFFCYSIASFFYRITLLWAIIWFIADKAFFIGVILAIWLVIAQIGLPILKGLRFVFTDTSIEKQRVRALTVCSLLLVATFIALFIVPASSSTQAIGVVRLPEDAQLRVGTDGFLSELLAESNDFVTGNAPIIRVEDVFLPARIEILKAQLKEVNIRYNAFKMTDRVKAEILKEEIIEATAKLDHALYALDQTTVRSQKQGNLVMFSQEDLPGKYVKKGELIGYVLGNDKITARVVVNQNDIGKVRHGVTSIELRLPGRLNEVLKAKVLRELPEATNHLPAAALATINGGPIVTDPNSPDELRAINKYFQIDLEVTSEVASIPIGSRVYVRFYHSQEPLANQLYRRIHQLFLKNFNA